MVTPGTNALEPVSVRNGAVQVAIVDEDPTARLLMRHWLEQAGYRAVEVASQNEALGLVSSLPQIVCIDLTIGGGVGHEILQRIHATNPHVPVVVVMAQRDAETAVAAMRAGAYDYVTKPADKERFIHAVSRAKERHDLLRSVHRLERELAERTLKGALGGHSDAIVELDQQVARVVDREVAVCLIGEEGSGKELVARAIYQGSNRRHGPYVRVDCGAFDAKEQEAILFGDEQGAGSVSCGAFEQASGGVLFLNQVGELSVRAQAALSQCLSSKSVRRVGGTDQIPVNVRVIAAHTEPLRRLVERGHFREDLFFRLVVYPVQIPSLRKRSDDIPLIVSHFLRELSGDSPRHLSPEALEALVRYSWPGNIRELEHVVHRSLLTARDEMIGLSDLPPEVRKVGETGASPAESTTDLSQLLGLPENEIVPLRDLERLAIEHALKVTNGSVTVAAQKLGIGRATLYRRIASLDLSLNVA